MNHLRRASNSLGLNYGQAFGCLLAFWVIIEQVAPGTHFENSEVSIVISATTQHGFERLLTFVDKERQH